MQFKRQKMSEIHFSDVKWNGALNASEYASENWEHDRMGVPARVNVLSV